MNVNTGDQRVITADRSRGLEWAQKGTMMTWYYSQLNASQLATYRSCPRSRFQSRDQRRSSHKPTFVYSKPARNKKVMGRGDGTLGLAEREYVKVLSFEVSVVQNNVGAPGVLGSVSGLAGGRRAAHGLVTSRRLWGRHRSASTTKDGARWGWICWISWIDQNPMGVYFNATMHAHHDCHPYRAHLQCPSLGPCVPVPTPGHLRHFLCTSRKTPGALWQRQGVQRQRYGKGYGPYGLHQRHPGFQYATVSHF